LLGRIGDVLLCEDGNVDLHKGFISVGVILPLRAALFVNDGRMVDQKAYRNEGYFLQILKVSNKIKVILVTDDNLYRTNFNQQYLLGNYDKRYFEEVYNSFNVRVMKLKRAAPITRDFPPYSSGNRHTNQALLPASTGAKPDHR
jgi:undecaprenyl-diphosphooligosaccharide---protein glycotransferase